MNYSTNTKKRQRIKRIVISWVIVLLVGILIGWLIGSFTGQDDSVQAMNLNESKEPYGTVDENFTFSSSVEWQDQIQQQFTPLDLPVDEELQEYIFTLSHAYNVDYSLVLGLIQTESDFRPTVVSQTNDFGLMQINKINHEWLKDKLLISDFLDPYQNTKAGVYILRNLFEKYEEPNLVLMAYNLGEHGASKLWDKGIYHSDYSIKVMENAASFHKTIQVKGEEK